ncbi:adenylate/guanylate cyclase domain-containing protein [Nocardioides sp.]|uniref:adenylate/guanylate cyclase domain-containing protein n=1 Tax=Nocardioides sp. TaxID=35761 RepID=UPI0035140085
MPEEPAADQSHEDGAFEPSALAEAVEALLLGGPRTLSTRQLADAAGMDLEAGQRLWRSMGFAVVEDEDEVALTAQDLHAMVRVKGAMERGVIAPDEVVGMARLAGQVFAQLAETEGAAMYLHALDRAGDSDVPTALAEVAEEVIPLLEEVHSYVWRRQLAAYAARRAAAAGPGPAVPGAPTPVDEVASVAFADISGFTSLSRDLTEQQLADLLEAFETVAVEAVGAHQGRVVKLIGDAVLFVAAEPGQALAIADELLASWPAHRPPLRIGIATGPVLRRLGDVFGPTVNLASRLTSLARPREVRVDATTRALTAPARDYDEQPPTDVRGYPALASWALRPPAAAVGRDRA